MSFPLTLGVSLTPEYILISSMLNRMVLGTWRITFKSLGVYVFEWYKELFVEFSTHYPLSNISAILNQISIIWKLNLKTHTKVPLRWCSFGCCSCIYLLYLYCLDYLYLYIQIYETLEVKNLPSMLHYVSICWRAWVLGWKLSKTNFTFHKCGDILKIKNQDQVHQDQFSMIPAMDVLKIQKKF